MGKLLQLNVTANWGSTGRIAESIGLAAKERGWDSTIAYGRYMNPSESNLIKVGNQWNVYSHYVRSRFFDGEGLGSKSSTNNLINSIEHLSPDIIHLHNIHDHWLNYPLLFEYFSTIKTPIVWTFHDCWAFTGGCTHFVLSGCEQWETHCKRCPFKKSLSLRRETRNHNFHIEKFSKLSDQLTIVSVSSWLDNLVNKSKLGQCQHIIIHNGVDSDTFCHKDSQNLVNRYGLENKKILLGVSNVWPEYKGLNDFIALSKVLNDSFRIVLIGLPKYKHKDLPANIIPIERTQNINVLAEWYSAATVVMSLSKAETFGMTLAEGLACGSPIITYRAGGCPEVPDLETGIIVNKGDIESLKNAILTVCNNQDKYSSEACRQRAVTYFNKDIQFSKYIDLYEDILSKK